MKRTLRIAPLLLGLIVLGCSGCIHSTTSTNPAVIRAVTLLDAENTVNTIAHGLQEANGTLKNLQPTEPDYYAFAHPKLVALAQANENANQAILKANAGDQTVNWKSAVFDVSAVAGDTKTLTAFGFKNPKTQQLVQLGFATLSTALSAASQFGGK